MTLIIGTATPAGPALPDLADAAVNPHGLTAEDLKGYPDIFWPLVLEHGRLKFGLSSTVLAINAALDNLAAIGRRHNCHKAMLAPLEAMAGCFVNMFEQVCTQNSWTPDDIKKVQGQITRAQVLQGAPRIVAADGKPIPRVLN